MAAEYELLTLGGGELKIYTAPGEKNFGTTLDLPTLAMRVRSKTNEVVACELASSVYNHYIHTHYSYRHKHKHCSV